MAIRDILTDNAPVLRKKSRFVERIDDRVIMLIDDMRETLLKAEGAGLAAPQVGVLRQVVVVDIGDDIIEMINPEIISTEGEDIQAEGCLSLPGQVGMVKRAYKVCARYIDRDGNKMQIEGEEIVARAILHEVDHLNGILFIDRAEEMLEPEDLVED